MNRNHLNKCFLLAWSLVTLGLAACSSSPAATQALPTETAALLTPTLLPTPTQPPTTPTPTVAPSCPTPIESTQLLTNEEMGYCLLYPDSLFRVDPYAAEVCLVPELPAMACHSNAAQFEVTDAAGRSASEVADAVIEQAGISIERSSLTLAGEEAVILDGVPAQDLLRDVLIVHDDRLYTLRFVLPSPEDPSAVERFERLYDTVINSFIFISSGPSPAPTESSQGSGR